MGIHAIHSKWSLGEQLLRCMAASTLGSKHATSERVAVAQTASRQWELYALSESDIASFSALTRWQSSLASVLCSTSCALQDL